MGRIPLTDVGIAKYSISRRMWLSVNYMTLVLTLLFHKTMS